MNKPSAETPTILMVDDNPGNLSVLFDLLSGQGFEMLVAEDGVDALTQAVYACPDLILLDILLPDMDGFSVCEQLKKQEQTQEIPVIFMSALAETVDKVKGLQLGAIDYITKPFQHEEVLARVNTHLTLRRLKVQLAESEERLSKIIESAMDAIITLDRQGRITLFNRAAERLFRCPVAELIGCNFDRFSTEEFKLILADYLAANEQGQKPAMWVPEGHIAVRADGESFPFEATLSCTEAGGQSLYTLILRDIGERQQLRGLNLYLEQELRSVQEDGELIGASSGLQTVMHQLQQVAPTDATVLISGETGTGKELIARAIHQRSARCEQTMVKLNCAAIPEGLVESELFGHEKGAFTGALGRKIGRFELADGGTLFLDEIGELSLDLQTKLLRVLQEGELERVGSARTIKVDVRIIAATNRDLAQRVSEGQFRADLFYRLNVFPLTLPPLRERRQDIPLLVERFIKKDAKRYAKKITSVPPTMMSALNAYEWPGNVRELQHVIERAVILTPGAELAFDKGFLQLGTNQTLPAPTSLKEVEHAHILKILNDTAWRVSGKAGAAELLGLKATTLESRMKRLGIVRPD